MGIGKSYRYPKQTIMTKKFFVAILCLSAHLVAYGQVDYAQQYKNAKDLFREGQYNLAMETFKPLIAYDQKNPYSPYASYYYALSAHYQGYDAVAKDMLLQIRKVYPQWDKLDEVNLWLGTIYLKEGEYFQGIKVLNAINNRGMRETIAGVKEQYLSAIEDPETLTMLLEEHPKDVMIARLLAGTLSRNLSLQGNRETLDSLIAAFNFERSDFVPAAPKTFHKDQYAVAVLLPFMLDELDARPGKKRNQIILEFYEGIRLALDSLNQTSPQISLRAYDTYKGRDHLASILATDELRNADLVIGPVYANEVPIVQSFSEHQQVNVVNPFSNNAEMFGSNPYAFLFQPAGETLGSKAAEYVAENTREKVCMVIAGTSKKDSAMAATFVARAHELGLEVVADYRFPREGAGKIIEILATPTEFDEFRFPTEFTLKKDSIGCIFVASDEPLIYTKVISSVETRGDSILVIGSENWVDNTAVPFEKYQNLGVVFMAPNFVSINSPARKSFYQRYLRRYGKLPSNFSMQGYELMVFFGGQLKKNGVYFQDALHESDVIPGYLGQGFYYPYTRDNQLIPFVRFENGVLKLVEVKE